MLNYSFNNGNFDHTNNVLILKLNKISWIKYFLVELVACLLKINVLSSVAF